MYLPLPEGDSQNSTGDIDIRDSNEDEGTHDHQGALCEGQKLIDRGVRAGEHQQRLDITEEVVDDVGPTEGEGSHDGMGEGGGGTPARGCCHELEAACSGFMVVV